MLKYEIGQEVYLIHDNLLKKGIIDRRMFQEFKDRSIAKEYKIRIPNDQVYLREEEIFVSKEELLVHLQDYLEE